MATNNWWICTDVLSRGGKKVLGPFASQELALKVRELLEYKESKPGGGAVTYWVERSMMREFLITLSTAEQERINADLKKWHTSSGPVFMGEDAPGLVSTATIKLEHDGIIRDEIERRFQIADPGCVIHKIQEVTEL